MNGMTENESGPEAETSPSDFELGAAVVETTIVAGEGLAGAPSKEEHMWALVAHLSALLALVGLPLGNILRAELPLPAGDSVHQVTVGENRLT